MIYDGAAGAGTPCRVETSLSEQDAVDRAIGEAKAGEFLLLLVNNIEGANERLKGRSFPKQADLAQH